MLLFFISIYALGLQAQSYTRGDSLRGGQRIERDCFDIFYYNLAVRLNIIEKSIVGVNEIHFEIKQSSSGIQLDLFENMTIDSIVFENKIIDYKRDFDAVFLSFPRVLNVGEKLSLFFYYHGNPIIARMPPWDGGFTWSKDKDGKDWVGVSCQGKGASLWWPTKEDYRDEPDSMRIHCTVPKHLIAVCNGTPESSTTMGNETTYHWKVSYPINNYNVTLNVANYVHWNDWYVSSDGDSLSLDYYVLPYNLTAAKKQFEQVKPMLSCYEQYLGKYPFYEDGYALVETPYLGMEHQGAIAYGNKFRNGYLGMDRSGQNLEFDYIIIHETGHEWWGNSVSAQDLADMWIHESFCTYSEAIYVECKWGYETALNYVNALKSSVSNSSPIIGVYGLNKEGNGDMYVKGMLFLNTLRHVVNNDTIWWETIYSMAADRFYHRTTNYDEVVAYFNEKTGTDLNALFHQYVKKKDIPVLKYGLKKCKREVELKLQWETQTQDFTMPVEFISDGKAYRIDVGSKEQIVKLKSEDITFNTSKFYFDLKKQTR